MNLPADIPSYLSSQGTLSEPQEGYSNLEAGSHQQLMPPAGSYMHKGIDGKESLQVCCQCTVSSSQLKCQGGFLSCFFPLASQEPRQKRWK